MATGKSLGKQRSKVSDTAVVAGQMRDVVMSLRVEGAMHDRLRKLAFDRREPMREFIIRGIESVLSAEKY